MKTPKEAAEKILAQIQVVVEARIRPMMGEYLAYVNKKLVGQINDSQLYIKVTQFGEDYAGDLQRKSPYDGAKPAFVVAQEKIDDADWLREFLLGTIKQL